MTNNFETGGTERQFVTIAQSLRQGRFQIDLGCIERKGPFREALGDVAEFPLGGSFLSLPAQRSRLALGRRLRSQRVAVAHSFDFYSNLMLIPTARLAGVPVVIGSKRQIGDLFSAAKRASLNLMYRLCDRVVCNSRAAADQLRADGVRASRLAVIPNGLGDEAFAGAAPALPREPGLIRIGLIARMNHPVKNHPLFLRAAAETVKRYPAVEFVLVGDGPLRGELESLAGELGLGEKVRFMGDRKDIPAVLAALDFTVVASRSESLSNVILESMAAGKPVVATRVGGNPELVHDGENGFLVPSDDPGSLAAAMDRLVASTDLRADFGNRARERTHKEFSLESVRNRLEELYRECLEEKGWSPQPAEKKRSVNDGGKNKMRIAIVAPSLRILGGQAVQADLLLRHWDTDPAVAASFIPVNPRFPPGLRWIEKIPVVRTIVRTPLYLWDLWRGLQHVQIAHIFSASYWSFLLAPAPAWAVARMRGKKTIINYRSAEARDHLTRFRSATAVLRRADRLIVPSRYLVDVFAEFGLSATVVPNIVDLEQFRFRERRPVRPLLVCTRNFDPYYSVDVAVRAFTLVQEKFPNARLCLVGSGSLEPGIRALARDLGLTGVEFAGAVSRGAIGRYLDQADIFINASWLDNMPVSILEAFAAGTPVVSTAPEGIKYIVEHERTGLLCEAGDWESLGKNVLRLLESQDLAARLAEKAHAESKQYHWEAVRRQWISVYEELLGIGVPAQTESAEGQDAGRPARTAGN